MRPILLLAVQRTIPLKQEFLGKLPCLDDSSLDA